MHREEEYLLLREPGPSDLGHGGVAQDEALGGGGAVDDELDAGGQGPSLALQADDGAHPVGGVATGRQETLGS